MKTADGVLFFKEWLPDLGDLDNPGLIEAENVLPSNKGYESFATFGTAAFGTLPATPTGAVEVREEDWNVNVVYAATNQFLYASTSGGAFTLLSATHAADSEWSFARYENIVIATAENVTSPLQHTLLAATGFTALSTSGTAPSARVVGVVGQFVVLGNLDGAPYSVRWSGIDNPNSWPAPGSSTATAQQSGQQDLNPLGPVLAIAAGDQFGLIFQRHAITRMTYEGGDTVFRFDTIATNIGIRNQNAVARIGGLFYFVGDQGVYVTDGVTVTPIGEGKVNKWWYDNATGNGGYQWAAVDEQKKLIYWTHIAGGFVPASVLVLHYPTGRFTHCDIDTRGLISPAPGSGDVVKGFDVSGNIMRKLNGSPGTAVVTTGDAEFNRGGKTFVQGVKPLVDATVNAVTVALGYRDDLQATPTFTAETTANSRSGFAGFRNEARYHRARLTITGTFNAAQGLEYQAVPTGAL